jgi:Fic family protein
MPSLLPKLLKNLNFSLEDIATLNAIAEYLGKQKLYLKQKQATLEGLQTVAAIESADASNRLEGITAPQKRIEALVNESAEPRDRSESEIAGYRDAMRLIHQDSEHITVTVNMILQLHGWLYSYMSEEGGRWKSIDNEIVEKDADGNVTRVRFKAVPAVATPQAMQDLVENYQQARKDAVTPLLAIPLFILDFLCIHPFRDGNGRVSRLLTNLLLYRARYDVGRYISLDRRFLQTREGYYSTLETSSQGWHENEHDPMPWVRYFWGVLLSAYKEFEERVGNIEQGKGSKTQRIRDAVERKITPFKIAELKRDLPDISREMIRKVLAIMQKEGLVRSEGRGPGARWIPSQKQ